MILPQDAKGIGMLADLIPNSVTMENGTDPENIGIPVAAMLNSRDSETLRKLILETKQKVLIYTFSQIRSCIISLKYFLRISVM